MVDFLYSGFLYGGFSANMIWTTSVTLSTLLHNVYFTAPATNPDGCRCAAGNTMLSDPV